MLVNANALRIPLADQSVHVAVTSPPYFGLRKYAGAEGQMGLEQSIEAYVANLVAVGREVWRVLHDNGTFYLNLGDCYNGSGKGRGQGGRGPQSGNQLTNRGAYFENSADPIFHPGLKPKDLMMIPARVSMALQAEGWYLRSEIVWIKDNPMPESIQDRPSSAHEKIYLFSKQRRYYYDRIAVQEPQAAVSLARSLRGRSDHHKNINGAPGQSPHTINAPRPNARKSGAPQSEGPDDTGWRNARNFFEAEADDEVMNLLNYFLNAIPPEKVDELLAAYEQDAVAMTNVLKHSTGQYRGSHFAVFPEAIPRLAILAGTSAKGHCAKCGKGWIREINKPSPPRIIRPAPKSKLVGNDSASAAVRKNGDYMNGPELEKWRRDNPTVTIGWQPACKCNAPIVPAIVLDPFCGSGTTGKVSRELGRRFVGLDLSLQYLRNDAMPRATRTNTQESMKALPLFQL